MVRQISCAPIEVDRDHDDPGYLRGRGEQPMSSTSSAIVSKMRDLGLVNALSFIWYLAADAGFDLLHGMRSGHQVARTKLATGSPNQRYSSAYQPTFASAFRRVLRRVAVARDGVFVDIGCGKGRILMLARRAGFQRTRGIEFSGILCRLARRNVRNKGLDGVAVIHQDATVYQYQDDEMVYYLFNPFTVEVLEPVVQAMMLSLRRHPRQLWIIYVGAVWREVFDRRHQLRRVMDGRVCGMPVVVYRAQEGW